MATFLDDLIVETVVEAKQKGETTEIILTRINLLLNADIEKKVIDVNDLSLLNIRNVLKQQCTASELARKKLEKQNIFTLSENMAYNAIKERCEYDSEYKALIEETGFFQYYEIKNKK